MADIKKQIIDFNLLTNIVGDNDNILLQRDNGTTFRTHVNNLPFTAQITALESSAGHLENNVTSLEITMSSVVPNISTLFLSTGDLYSTAGYLENEINNIKNDIQSVDWDIIINTPTTLAGYGIVDGIGTNGNVPILEVTYQELTDLLNISGLIQGAYYVITNFRTCYDRPDYDYNRNAITNNNYKQAAIEPLIVRATGKNIISEDAFQPAYPKDKIKYDITWNITEWTENPAFGRITERIDEFNNRTDYDHRTILFKRYRTYFYDLTNPLSGTIDINGVNVVGTDTNFSSGLAIGNIIHTKGYDFRITSIADDTSMTIEGNNLLTDTGLLYYYAESIVDGDFSNVPYTHTQITNVTEDGESTAGDYLMNGHVADGEEYFGATSGYFTNLYPGLFVLSAYDISIDEFSIQGNLGADGEGDFDYYQYSTSFNSINYEIYIKRVGNATDPSINHIIIIDNGTNGTNGIVRTIGEDTDDDLDRLSNLLENNVTQIHYLLTSKHLGVKLTNEEVTAVVNAYLALVDPLSIDNTLASLNTNYSDITSLITSLYLFNDNGAGYIDDGGDDMYDGGNFIYTNLGQHWKSYNWYQNNIPNDNSYRNLKTFQTDLELIQNQNTTTRNNYIGNHSDFHIADNLSSSEFLLSNNVFGLYSYSNKLGDRCFNNHTYNWFNRNTISGTFQRNIIKRGFYSNIIGEYFTENIINSYFWSNEIGDEFYGNECGYEFHDNIINNYFDNNYIIRAFYNNTIDTNFYNNKIHYDFYNNTLDNNFNSNTTRFNFYGNTIGIQFENNTLGNGVNILNFYDNVLGHRCKGCLMLGNFYGNTIGVDFYSNVMEGDFIFNSINNFNIFNNFGSNFNSNILYNNNYSNHIGENFNNNKIYNNFINNTIINNFQYNLINTSISSVDFTSATHVYQIYSCEIFLASNSNQYLNYFDGQDKLYVSINA